MKPQILAFAGSTRTDSFNKKLVRIAAAGATNAGGDVTVVDLRDFPMPLYDGDLEEKEGLPPHAQKLGQIFLAHQGLLIASPEYNSGFSGVIKNTIDWLSRIKSGEKSLACFSGKVATLMSASPGNLGGLRGLALLRTVLGNIQVLVLPDQVCINTAHEAFAADGSLKDAKRQASVEKLGATLVSAVGKWHA